MGTGTNRSNLDVAPPRAILLAASHRPGMVSYGGVLAACSRGEAWTLGYTEKNDDATVAQCFCCCCDVRTWIDMYNYITYIKYVSYLRWFLHIAGRHMNLYIYI